MNEHDILAEAEALNDFIFTSPHEGATKDFFDARAISLDDQYRIIDASIRLLKEAEQCN